MKRFSIQYGIGHARYVVNYHDGQKKHPDGSDFFDIDIFHNKKAMGKFVKSLHNNGYQEV